MLKDVVILGAARTPIGRFQGELASQPAPRLGAVAIQGAIARAGVDKASVSDVLMGQVIQAGTGQAPARQAALLAGLSPAARAVTVHKVCGSGMQALFQASLLVQADLADVVVAGGMESMSRAPFLLPGAREGYRLGHQQVIDTLISDGLWDPHCDLHMGSCAERCATSYAFTREAQDAYAVESFARARAAQTRGALADEIAPVPIDLDRRLDHDEGPARLNLEKMPTLRPAFDRDGTITAANASPLSDGAAAVIVANAATAARLNARPVGKIVAFGFHAQDPVWFSTAPIEATRNALAAAGWAVADVDLWEVNEAFAVVPMAFMRDLGVPHERLNVRGGAIALGHPIGCSGARIVVTLLAALREAGLRRGVASICIGGGEGMTVCVESLAQAARG